MDLKAEVEKLVGQAIVQARLMDREGPLLLGRIESRLDIAANILEMPEPLKPDKLTDPVCNAAGRAEALHAFSDAFGRAAEWLKSAA
jgi:hypothetical protein